MKRRIVALLLSFAVLSYPAAAQEPAAATPQITAVATTITFYVVPASGIGKLEIVYDAEQNLVQFASIGQDATLDLAPEELAQIADFLTLVGADPVAALTQYGQ